MIKDHVQKTLDELVLEDGAVLFANDERHRKKFSLSAANFVYGMSYLNFPDFNLDLPVNLTIDYLDNQSKGVLPFSLEDPRKDVTATSLFALGKRRLGRNVDNNTNEILKFVCLNEKRKAFFKFPRLFEEGGFHITEQYSIFGEYLCLVLLRSYLRTDFEI